MHKKIALLVGTRPNFIKITLFEKLLLPHKEKISLSLIHTGQHTDEKMSAIFFKQLNLRKPDYLISPNNSSIITFMSSMMVELETILVSLKPDLLLVVGDVTSTMVGSLVANKMRIPLGHIESGLRSRDKTMPEEINRIVTDSLSDYFFITEQSGLENLISEEKPIDRLFMVGNTMIDTLLAFETEIEQSPINKELNLKPNTYGILTMHRPSNVDNFEGLQKITDLIKMLTEKKYLIFPIHPRTKSKFIEWGLYDSLAAIPNLILCESLDYFSFQHLLKFSVFIITDSGGVQEESTFLGIPCLTLRPNTERPITITHGSNTLIPFDKNILMREINSIEIGTYKKGSIPPLWDGKSTERIITHLLELLFPAPSK